MSLGYKIYVEMCNLIALREFNIQYCLAIKYIDI